MDSSQFDRLTRTLGARLSRRNALAGGIAGLSAFAFSGRPLPAFAQDATPEAASSEHRAFMFVQLADSGNWVPKPDEEGVYLLSLTGIGDQTLYFSEGTAGTFPTDHMLRSLGFTPINPPNAAVVVQTPDGVQDVLVVELFNPVFTEGAPGSNQLTYEATVLNTYTGAGLDEWVPQAEDDQLPVEFTNVSLFIDDCPGIMVCALSTGNNQFSYVGEIPGGPYRQCLDESTGICVLCEGSFAEFDALCREAYADTCAQGVCFTNVCDFPEWFGEMNYC
jgi:hypothetical protein